MLKLIDLTFFTNTDCNSPQQLIEMQKEALGYAVHLKNLLNVEVIKHLNYEGSEKINDVSFTFFKGSNRFAYIPFKTLRYIKQLQPDIILVQGLIFPIQVIALRLFVGNRVKIIVQHHGGNPGTGWLKALQRSADFCINAYLFTAVNNANNWLSKRIISNKNKCFELQEASTYFTRQNTVESRHICGMEGQNNYLWVGRLNDNKDPITVLNAFEKYTRQDKDARLYMIFQTEELLDSIKELIHQYTHLKSSVFLIGKVDKEKLPFWYTAANFYISASHNEGSGYALLEAMACGCIPLVTDIPSFSTITENGQYGFLYEKGDSNALLELLIKTRTINQKEHSEKIIRYFNSHLSFSSIAENLYAICKQLVPE